MLSIETFVPTIENHTIAAYLHNLKYHPWPRDLKQIIEDYDLIRKDIFHQAFLARENEIPIAYLAIQESYWLQKPHPYCLSVWSSASLPEATLAQFADYLEGIAAKQGATKTQIEDVDILGKLEFWKARGYVSTLDCPVSRCHVSKVNFDQFASQEASFRHGGYEIVTLAELEAQGDWRERIWQLKEAILDDVPHSEPRSPQTFERFCEVYPSEMAFPRLTTFFAMKDGELAGMSGGEKTFVNPTSFDTHLTGTRREHRRQGIATSLKLHVIRWCQENGVLTIDTGNEKDNPMYQLNLALGFEKFCTWCVMDRS